MESIYRFYQDWSYGCLTGIFIAHSDDIEFLLKHQEIWFNAGEVCGKYSECTSNIDINDIEVVSDDIEFVLNFKKYNASTGYNPLTFNLEPYEMDNKYVPILF